MSQQLQSLCVLGRQPALGLAELESLYGSDAVTPLSTQVAGLALPANSVQFSRLGGSTRLATVLATVPSTNWKLIEKQLTKCAVDVVRTLPEGKVQLGLSAIDFPVSASRLGATGLTLKKVLRGRLERGVRVTPNTEPELNTAQVQHNHLTGPTGIELLVIASPNGGTTTIARTIAVQDIASYTTRDRGRPKRDARVGMLPPKLAQILVNTATATTNPLYGDVVLDPFCGTGVVLQEATLMGFDVYGTDLDPRMVSYTDQNLMWLLDQPECPVSRPAEYAGDPDWRYYKLEQGDATTHQWKPTPSIVACETYLGRPFTTPPTPDILAQTVSEVNLIIRKFLRNIHAQLAPGARLCLGVPAWQTAPGRFKHLPLIDQISDLGYNRVSFRHVQGGQLLYYREDQIVARELLVLTRK